MKEQFFEVSWEVCNKVGGINTVIKSKAERMKKEYPNYTLIGPYFKEKAELELEEKKPPKELATAFKKAEAIGIKVHYGEWQIKGNPNTILIDFTTLIPKKNLYKKELWETHKIDSLYAGWDFEEPMLFSRATAIVLKLIQEEIEKNEKERTIITAQCHEWLAGLTILFLKNIGKKGEERIRTIFTTHATMLGRAIAGSGEPLYEVIDEIAKNPEAKAREKGVITKYQTERESAHKADVFTTVSEITGFEAEKLLDKKPDIILPNGLDIEQFPTIEETSIKHITCRDKIREFLAYYFFPHYSFDLKHNLIFFITARNEFRNKGIDITIKALSKLNQTLKKNPEDPRTITMFFWIPMSEGGLRITLLENKNYYNHLKNLLNYNSEKILQNVLYDLLSQKEVTDETLFTKEFLRKTKGDLIMFKRKGEPPLSTHYLDENNEIIRALKQEGLTNKREDKVKVIVMPIYLNGNDGLFNLPYYEAIAGSHLGLFPSYYEPWGYTPLESAIMGVSALTSDLSGFGQYIKNKTRGKGIFILERMGKTEEETINNYHQLLLRFSKMNHSERVQNKLEAKRLASTCDWKEFIKHYKEAYEKAKKS